MSTTAAGSGALATRKCKACTAGSKSLTDAQVQLLLPALPDWKIEKGVLTRTLKFLDYYQTVNYVNAIAYIANQQDHHPDMLVGYNTLTVNYSTHSVGGLSENDFICAAKVDALLVAGDNGGIHVFARFKKFHEHSRS